MEKSYNDLKITDLEGLHKKEFDEKAANFVQRTGGGG